MADVESAVLYTLRIEAAVFANLEGEQLSTLKDFVSVLVQVSDVTPFNRRDFPNNSSLLLLSPLLHKGSTQIATICSAIVSN